MKSRVISLIIVLSFMLSLLAGCTSSTEVSSGSSSSQAAEASNEPASSNVDEASGEDSTLPEESESNPPQTDNSDASDPDEDFFTVHGQGVLPEETNIPSHYVETETENLYKLNLPFPDAEGFSAYAANNVLLLFYFDGDNQFCDMLSLESGELIKRISVGYDSEWGQFADGGFWLVSRIDLSVKFYDAEGNETLAKEGNTSEDYVYPETLHITSDKKYLVTISTSGTDAEVYNLESGKTSKIEIPSNLNVWEISEVSGGIFLDGGNGVGVLYNPQTEKSEVLTLDGEVGFFYGDIYECMSDKCIAFGGLNSEKFVYVPSDANDYVQDLKYGCAVISNSIMCTLTFLDLRSGTSSVLYTDEDIYGCFSSLLDDGTALIFEYTQDGVNTYIYDVVSAFKGDETETVEILCCTDAELEQKISEIAERIYNDIGVEVLYGSEGNDFDIYDYVGVAALDQFEIYQTVKTVEDILSIYPEGMLKEAYSETHKGIKLYLCANLYGTQAGTLDTAGGVTTVQAGYIVVVLDIHDSLWYNIPHEFSHVFDYRINELSFSGENNWMSIWDAATPFDDAYVYSYDEYENNYKYTIGYELEETEDVWFVDGYGRTFPTEDRARLFEYMFITEEDPGFSNIYEYENLVTKAKLYSYILRQCFPSCNTEEPNPWEKNLGVIDSSVVPDAENPVPVV